MATIERVIRYYSPFPAWDYWRVPYNAFFYKLRGFELFLKPHNEHRVVFPEIIWQLDLLFHGRLILSIVFSFLCYFALWFVLAWIIYRDREVPHLVRLVAALLAGIILGWQGSAVVIADAFLLQWTLSSLCVVSSVFLIARGRSVVLALITAVVATYSSGNCLLLWPVLLLEAWALRLPRRQIATVAVIGAAAIAAYFIDYHPGSGMNVLAVLKHPLPMIGFFISYIAMPFGLSKSDTFAICLGSLNILLILFLFLYVKRRKLLYSPTPVALFCIYLFTLLTAALTTAGRINLTGGYGEAKASRYWAIQLLNWADVALLCLYVTSLAPARIKTKATVAIVLTGLIAYSTLKLRSSLSYDDNQFANRQLAALGFENGLEDPTLARRIFPDPRFVFSLLPFLQDRDLSVYSLANYNSLGKPAKVAGHVVSESRSGAVISTMPVIGGIEVIGWADPERNGSEKIIFLNEKRDIAGVGRKLPAAFPSDLRSLNVPIAEGWVGFVNLKYSTPTVMPFFLTHGRLEQIGSAIPLNTNLERVPADAGLLLSGFEWHKDPAWTRNGLPRLTFPDNLPRGEIYASWSGDDRNRGTIASSVFAAPATGCLLIPVMHGPRVQGLSLEILEADTGRAIQNIPMQNGDLGWQFWKVRLDKFATHLRIEAQDQGADWGQWLAIAQPSACDIKSL